MFGKVVIWICWLVTFLSSLLGAYVLWGAVTAQAAPAQGAAAAVACGLAVIPYVITRAIEGMEAPRKP